MSENVDITWIRETPETKHKRRKLDTDSSCRLCAQPYEVSHGGTKIFAKSGERKDLATKIENFLSIQISKDDGLPKCVCRKCESELQRWEKFNTMVGEAQLSFSLKSQNPTKRYIDFSECTEINYSKRSKLLENDTQLSEPQTQSQVRVSQFI